MEPLISVIIPIYNMEPYLERCLDSVLNNSYRNLEVICVDDGSEDASAEILYKYAKRDRRVVPIFKKNGGVSSARNAGLNRMTGEFATFIDPDDFVHPQYIELMLTAQRLSGADIIIGGYQHTKSISAPSNYPCLSLSVEDIRLVPAMNVCQFGNANSGVFSRLISRQALGMHRYCSDFSYGEDTLFALEMYSDQPTMQVGIIPHRIYYYYKGRADSLVYTRRDRDVLRYLTVLAEKASEKEKEHIYLETLVRRGLYFRYYYTYVQNEAKLSNDIDKLLRHHIRQLLSSRSFPLRFRAARTLFILFPGLDRKYRVFRDPSLKNTEKI